MTDMCPVCPGSGSLLTTKRGLEWWDCPCCKGAGVTVQYGPAMVGPKSRPTPSQTTNIEKE